MNITLTKIENLIREDECKVDKEFTVKYLIKENVNPKKCTIYINLRRLRAHGSVP